MSTEHVEPGEGHSPAAWTGVTLMLLGIASSTLALFLGVQWLFITGVIVLVLGPIVGTIISKAGYGAHGPKYTPKSHQ